MSESDLVRLLHEQSDMYDAMGQHSLADLLTKAKIALEAAESRAATLEQKLIEAERTFEASRLALEAERASHGHDHWDRTMQHGLGCPKCIDQRNASELTRKAMALLDAALAQRATEGK